MLDLFHFRARNCLLYLVLRYADLSTLANLQWFTYQRLCADLLIPQRSLTGEAHIFRKYQGSWAGSKQMVSCRCGSIHLHRTNLPCQPTYDIYPKYILRKRDMPFFYCTLPHRAPQLITVFGVLGKTSPTSEGHKVVKSRLSSNNSA
jgi:hypothetical protein